MKLVINTPPPVEAPPKTYDITGLTEKEFLSIALAVGMTSPAEIESGRGLKGHSNQSSARIAGRIGNAAPYTNGCFYDLYNAAKEITNAQS